MKVGLIILLLVKSFLKDIQLLRDDDGKLTMHEIEDVYKDILAEYPNCGGFERNVAKFMAEVKRIIFLNAFFNSQF